MEPATNKPRAECVERRTFGLEGEQPGPSQDLALLPYSFSGEIKFARKHTRFIVRDLPQLVSRSIGLLAQFICLSVNLLQLLEHELARQGIRNAPEEKRRAARLQLAGEAATKAKTAPPKTLRLMQQITQHSVKFIRWAAAQLWNSIPWPQACAVLIALYSKL